MNQLPAQAWPPRPGAVRIAAALAVLVVAAAGPGAAAADTVRRLASGATAPDRDVQIPALAPVEVSPNGRFLQFTDGRPFFWLADTGWEMFHRAGRDDARLYLDTRAEQGFTVIQAVALAEKGGWVRPATARSRPTRLGRDDATAGRARSADGGHGPRRQGPRREERATDGEFLGARYGGKNVFFVLGGDRESHAGGNTPEVWGALAEGIRETDTGNT